MGSEDAGESRFEWIIQFKHSVQQFGEGTDALGMRIKYPFIVPKQMKMLKTSAYTPEGNLYLGLNSTPPMTQEQRNVTDLKAKWASNYLKWRRSARGSQNSDLEEWKDLVKALNIEVGDVVQNYEMGFQYVPSQHEERLKEWLAADAVFVTLYLLRMAKKLPARDFSWMRGDPYLKTHSVYFLKDLFLLENQIPLTILLAAVNDFCQSRKVEQRPGVEDITSPSPESLSLLKTAVLVALGERLEKVFRLADSKRIGRDKVVKSNVRQVIQTMWSRVGRDKLVKSNVRQVESGSLRYPEGEDESLQNLTSCLRERQPQNWT